MMLLPVFAWATCDDAKIYPSDEILSQADCNSLNFKGCMIKAFTREGREYVGVRVESSGTKVVQVYKWLDTPNNQSAKYWEATQMSKLTNMSSQYKGRLTTAKFWRITQKLEVSVRNFLKNKKIFEVTLQCK